MNWQNLNYFKCQEAVFIMTQPLGIYISVPSIIGNCQKVQIEATLRNCLNFFRKFYYKSSFQGF